MLLLALAALIEPLTPPEVLQVIADTRDPQTTAYLLTHPNTPAGFVTATRPGKFEHRVAAMHSPAATDATRARLQARNIALFGDMNDARNQEPWWRDALMARYRERPNLSDASNLFDYAGVGVDTRTHALRMLMESAAARQVTWGVLGARMVHAATRLPDWDAIVAHADRARSLPGGSQSFALRQIRDLASSHDPHAAYMDDVRAKLAAATLTPAMAVSAAPDPAFADEVLATYAGDHHLLTACTTAPALRGSAAWRAGMYCVAAGQRAPAGLTVTDLDVFVAEHAPPHRTTQIAEISEVHLDAGPDVLQACTRAADRTGINPTIAGMLARIALHPATRDYDRADAHRRLLHPVTGAWPATVARLFDSTNALPEAVAAAPMQDLRTIAAGDPTAALLLAHHAQDTVRDLWTDPVAARAALALEGDFTGTLTELVTTVAAISV